MPHDLKNSASSSLAAPRKIGFWIAGSGGAIVFLAIVLAVVNFFSSFFRGNDIDLKPGTVYEVSRGEAFVGKMPEDDWVELEFRGLGPLDDFTVGPADDTSIVNLFFPFRDEAFNLSMGNTKSLVFGSSPENLCFKVRGYGRMVVATGKH